MQLMYVDESGDPGCVRYASKHYILSGLIVSDRDWKTCLDKVKIFRQHLKATTGLLIRTEIHAAELIRISKIEAYRKIRKPVRIKILQELMQQLPAIFDKAVVINICLEKSQFPANTNFQELAWSRLIQRYDTYLKKTANDIGIIVADDSDDAAIRKLLRKMRVYNPTPSHYSGTYNAPTDNIIEDVFMRSSQHSMFIQAVDCISHCLYRREFPKGSLKKFGVENYFNYIDSILLKIASTNDPCGIVRK
ncbi:DUF3800 domain-containing protein [Fibrella sp. WM1]|uniref:DUF3800 domain-containing protein n=1 Tax=Fibrella musci TaxID=3242485 RepID=UPI003520DD5B